MSPSLPSIVRIPFIALRAVREFLFRPTLFFRGLLPFGLSVLIFILSVSLTINYRESISHLLFGPSSGAFFNSLTVIGSILLSTIISVVVVVITSELLLDGFLTASIASIGISSLREGPPLGFGALLRLLVFRLIILFVLAVMSIVGLFFPPLHPVTWILSSLYLGHELVHAPAASLGITLARQRVLFSKHRLELLSLGALFSIVVAIPLIGLAFLPIAYLAGTILLEKYLRRGSL